MPRLRRFLALVLTLLAFALGGAPAYADEPVLTTPRDAPLVLQPERITIPPVPSEFQRRDLGWLHLAYAPSIHEQVDALAREADEVKARLADEFGQRVLTNVEVRVARTPEEMTSLAPAQLPPFPYASGMAYPPLHLILLTLQAPGSAESPDLPEVFRHELSHIALEDAVAGNPVPRWFNEGLAVHESGESFLKRSSVLSQATLSKTILPLADLDKSFPSDRYEVNVAYAESADFVRFLLRQADRARFAALIERVREGQPFEHALTDAYGTDLRKLDYEWREELAKRYSFVPVLTSGALVWVVLV